MYCQNCGKEIDDSVKFCPYCGEGTAEEDSLYDDVEYDDTVYVKQKNTDRKVLVIILIVVIVVAAALTAKVLFFPDIQLPFNTPFGNTTAKDADPRDMDNMDALESKDDSDSMAPIVTENSEDKNKDDNRDKSEDNTEEEESSNDEYSDDSENREADVSSEASPPYFSRISASSERKPDGKNTYPPSYAFDGNPETSWVEGVSGVGTGEFITFSADSLQQVTGIRIQNGYYKSEDLYYKNNRIKSVSITFDSGTSVTIDDMPDDYSGFYEYVFDAPIDTRSVTITIGDVYIGSKYPDDTVVSDIEFF
jgi:hypothetical protein